jgi:DNA-binding PadR family transcriptional regulator
MDKAAEDSEHGIWDSRENSLAMPRMQMYPISMNFRGGLTTMILQNLSRGPNHGYRIAQDIKLKSKGVLDFKEGALYPALHGLEGKGWISSQTRPEKGRVRCYYKLTEKGRKALATEKLEWARFSDAFNLILQEAP